MGKVYTTHPDRHLPAWANPAAQPRRPPPRQYCCTVFAEFPLLNDVIFFQGDGIDFKKHFMKIKELLKSIISRVPAQWPGISSQTWTKIYSSVASTLSQNVHVHNSTEQRSVQRSRQCTKNKSTELDRPSLTMWENGNHLRQVEIIYRHGKVLGLNVFGMCKTGKRFPHCKKYWCMAFIRLNHCCVSQEHEQGWK